MKVEFSKITKRVKDKNMQKKKVEKQKKNIYIDIFFLTTSTFNLTSN